MIGVLAMICAFYTIESVVCVALYRYLKEEQRNEETQREKFEELTKKLTNLNNAIAPKPSVLKEAKMRNEIVANRITAGVLNADAIRIEKALNSYKTGLIEEIIKTDLDDYRTAQQMSLDEAKMRKEIERRLNTTNKLIFVDEKVEEVIQTGLNDYIVKINRRYLDE